MISINTGPYTNPVIQARLAFGLTRSELASTTHLAVTTIEYIEDGSYGVLPSRLLQFLEINIPELQNKYSQWQMTKRIHSSLPSLIPLDFPQLSDIMHPHSEWRELVCGESINSYCASLCIPRAVVQNYESKRQVKFPFILSQSLIFAVGSDTERKLVRICNSINSGV